MTVKEASHMVPQSKRAEAFNLYKQILDGHVESTPRSSELNIEWWSIYDLIWKKTYLFI